MRIVSFNVNGIRAAMKRGFGDWLAATEPDVLCLQEVRAPDKVLAGFFKTGWHVAHHESTLEGAKGRAGVAILSRKEPVATSLELPDHGWAGHGRWVEADFETNVGPVTVVSAYVHSGEVDTPKQDAKYEFLETVTTRLAQCRDEGQHMVLTGDINIGHTELDIKNWKGNRNKAGFLPEEREYLTQWTGDLGFVDVVRDAVGDQPGPYSWWSWRGQAFDNDAGWRIDYHLVTPGIADTVRHWRIDRSPSYAERISDHAPVVVEYDL